MDFGGIPTAALDFYEDLESDNSKAFWLAHKHVYDQSVRAPMEALATALEPEFGTPKLFRPYRDVRFAKDKTPYKTHQGIWFAATSRYVQVSAAGLMLAGGYWHTESAQVQRLRRALVDDVAGAEFDRAIATVRRSRLRIGGEQLTRVPSGYDKDHPRADWLRHKTLTASQELTDPAWLATPRARAEIASRLRRMEPLVAWLDTHVGRELPS